jgi:hypothetical protein
MVILPLIEKIKPLLLERNIPKDEFGKESLKAVVNWTGFEGIGGWILAIGVIVFLFYNSKNISKAIFILLFATLLSISLSIVLITPKVEAYSQGAAIEFYKSKINENCFIQPLGFKSYAHLFYAQKKTNLNPKNYSEEWLLKEKTSIPVYCVVKINRSEEYEKYYPQLEKIYQKNGFVFYKKKN